MPEDGTILASRRFPSAEKFVEAFMSTIKPGIIPRAKFIDWPSIKKKMSDLQPGLAFFVQLKEMDLTATRMEQEISGSLLSSDDPLPYLRCAFELIAHTRPKFASLQDDFDIAALAQKIKAGDSAASHYFARLLADVGFHEILSRQDLEDVLFGVQVGLETHRRKNVGGKQFALAVGDLLQPMAARVTSRSGHRMAVAEEEKIPFRKGTSKHVDFSIHVDDKVRFGVEVNFYTSSGSKPSEIKRSYGDLRRELLSRGIDLIWVTDGMGYREMKQSLRDAYLIHPNIYSFEQATQYLEDDLVRAIQHPAKH